MRSHELERLSPATTHMCFQVLVLGRLLFGTWLFHLFFSCPPLARAVCLWSLLLLLLRFRSIVCSLSFSLCSPVVSCSVFVFLEICIVFMHVFLLQAVAFLVLFLVVLNYSSLLPNMLLLCVWICVALFALLF